MNGDYKLVYDVTQDSSPLWFLAFGLIFVVVGVVFWRFGERLEGSWRGPWGTPRARKISARFLLGFSVLWTGLAATAVLGTMYFARRALRSGTAAVVEGPVQEFHPAPYGGHDTERFRVASVHFAYSDYVVQAGFNRTSSHGGPIREGLMVRIHYSGPRSHATILRLEIQE